MSSVALSVSSQGTSRIDSSVKVWRFAFKTASVAPVAGSAAEVHETRAHPNNDIISGLKFCATMQLRTPLRVLLRHGELFSDLPNDPPQIAREMWEGIWIAQARSFRELGIGFDELALNQMTSAIGPIPADGGGYLRFLIAVREIVESANSIDDRMEWLRDEVSKPQWAGYVNNRFHGVSDICDYFFPRFLDTIGRLPDTAAEVMRALGLTSPKVIAGTADVQLFAIKGVGPAILHSIRTRCAEITADQHHDRLDMVAR
ncbi:hypothetical protein ACQ4WQ_08645 [Janthinobacterium sp. GB1R12]|uniref:hypothetical protein n=1 Tax=Janthinobacterium sp. GB1R12 TaxID=3424190 RepID=UPI003F1ED1F0